jgi:hypothetical protein
VPICQKYDDIDSLVQQILDCISEDNPAKVGLPTRFQAYVSRKLAISGMTRPTSKYRLEMFHANYFLTSQEHPINTSLGFGG